MRILVTDGIDANAKQQLLEKGHEVVEQFYAPEELGLALREFDAAVIRSATKIRAAQIRRVSKFPPQVHCASRRRS